MSRCSECGKREQEDAPEVILVPIYEATEHGSRHNDGPMWITVKLEGKILIRLSEIIHVKLAGNWKMAGEKFKLGPVSFSSLRLKGEPETFLVRGEPEDLWWRLSGEQVRELEEPT